MAYEPVRNGKPVMKMEAMHLTYEDERLVADGKRFTACEMQAFWNMVHPDAQLAPEYRERLRKAVHEEQRQKEKTSGAKRWNDDDFKPPVRKRIEHSQRNAKHRLAVGVADREIRILDLDGDY